MPQCNTPPSSSTLVDIPEWVSNPTKFEAVNEFTTWMKSTLDKVQAALTKLKDDMTRYYNQQQTPAPKFMVGEKVFFDASDISMTRPTKKLT
jgi:hypothetical protein